MIIDIESKFLNDQSKIAYDQALDKIVILEVIKGLEELKSKYNKLENSYNLLIDLSANYDSLKSENDILKRKYKKLRGQFNNSHQTNILMEENLERLCKETDKITSFNELIEENDILVDNLANQLKLNAELSDKLNYINTLAVKSSKFETLYIKVDNIQQLWNLKTEYMSQRIGLSTILVWYVKLADSDKYVPLDYTSTFQEDTQLDIRIDIGYIHTINDALKEIASLGEITIGDMNKSCTSN